MSIFKETLLPYVITQLETRTDVISTTNTRSAPFLAYTTGKNGWVRMSSFVDYNDSKRKYSGSELARKYILEGGTLKKTGDDESLRFGVGNQNSVYLSDLDGFNSKGQAPSKSNTSAFGDFRQLGARPMPGITSAEIVNKSAYGSLKEATVKYYCWDKHQLEELELLYMRTGYTVLLEWGWSKYLESKDKVSNIGSGIDIFYSGLTDEIIYNEIENLRQKYKGNYDALLGHVKNFSWQLMPNGGYECTTILISRGEIISTLRLSSNSLDDAASSEQSIDNPLSTFERVFLNYKAWINILEVDRNYLNASKSDKDEDKANRYSQSPQEFKPIYNSETGEDTDNPINDISVARFAEELKNRVSKIPSFPVYGYSKKANWLPENYSRTGEDFWTSIETSKGVAVICDAGAEDGTAIEYIRLDHFLVILNTYFNLKDKSNNLISKINIPQFVPCLASEDSVSVDPRVCLIRNPNAKFITDTDLNIPSIDSNYLGFQPYTITSYEYIPGEEKGKRLSVSDRGKMLPYHLSDTKNLGTFVPESKKYSYGTIDNIYVSLNTIVGLYRSKGGGNPDGVLMIDYLKDLLTQISSALGGINDFQLHVEKDQIRIIDVKYLELKSGDKSNNFNKYDFDLIGLKSICRDVKITSRIFDSQSTMIAISAQNKANIGDIYSSTQTYFNRGLRDRLLPSKLIDTETPTDNNQNSELNYYIKLWNSISAIAYYLREKCIGIPDPANVNRGVIKVPNDNDINNAKSIVKTIHYQINGYDTDFKAIIPFELELTLDGISGLVVGQIFTINKSILPRDYAEKNIGFIITGINHSLQNNDWKTNIKTQVCLLDQETLAKEFSFSKEQKVKIKDALTKIKSQAIRNQFLAWCITDFLFEKVNILLLPQKVDSLRDDPTRYALSAADKPYLTWRIGTQFLAKNGSYQRASDNTITRNPVPQTIFTDYGPKWIEEVKAKYPSVYNDFKDKEGNNLFPQSFYDLQTFVLDDNSKKYQFNDAIPDLAFSFYNSYTPGKVLKKQFGDDPQKYITSNVLTFTKSSQQESIQSYFSVPDTSEFPSYQNKTLSARNSALANRIIEFDEEYCDEFQGNIMYVNSIFGRGLEGTIELIETINVGNGIINASGKKQTFDLEDQGNNNGLTVNAQSTDIDVKDYKENEVFKIRGRTSNFAGKNSGIEKYLSKYFINTSKLSIARNPSAKDLWDNLFKYVTEDLLNPIGGLLAMSEEERPSFQANANLISQIKGTGLQSIYFK